MTVITEADIRVQDWVVMRNGFYTTRYLIISLQGPAEDGVTYKLGVVFAPRTKEERDKDPHYILWARRSKEREEREQQQSIRTE